MNYILPIIGFTAVAGTIYPYISNAIYCAKKREQNKNK